MEVHQKFVAAEGLWQGYEVPAGVSGGEQLYEGRFVGDNGQAGDRTGQRDTWDVEVSIWHRPNA